MEPFSTSNLQGIARVFATTTKICTDGGSRQAHAQSLPRTPPRPSYSLRPVGPGKFPVLPQWLGIGVMLKRHPFSELVASAGESLHIPWRVPTSMATVLLSLATNAFPGF